MKGWYLFSKIVEENQDNIKECWNWTGGTTSKGYPTFQFNGVKWSAHRYSYAKFKGKIGNMYVLHKCDNKICINPNHLELGTHIKNIQDYWDRSGNKKLTKEKIQLIFELRDKGILLKDIGLKFGISESYVSLIIRGKRNLKCYKERT